MHKSDIVLLGITYLSDNELVHLPYMAVALLPDKASRNQSGDRLLSVWTSPGAG